MNKGELINHVAQKVSISKDQASAAVNAVFDSIEESLKNGDKAAILGFGTFSTAERAARKGINPLTKEPIDIPAKTQVKFKAGKSLAATINIKN